jgi:hypothetical protein
MMKHYVEVIGTLITTQTDIWSKGVVDLRRVPYEFWAKTFITQLTNKTGDSFDYYELDDGTFKVYRIPTIGDPVSMTHDEVFYPCGEIESITKTLKRITTTDGKTFIRYRDTDNWLFNGWLMVPGTKFYVK